MRSTPKRLAMRSMLSSERLRKLMEQHGLSQSELGRRVGVTQATIYKLLTGVSYGSKHLHRIARELGTTPAYLTGETNDPAPDALPPPPPPVHYVMMPVALPPEPALAEMFDILLAGINPNLSEADRSEQAQLLAERLPIGLSRLQSQRIDQRRAAPRDRPAKGVRSPAATRLPEPQR